MYRVLEMSPTRWLLVDRDSHDLIAEFTSREDALECLEGIHIL